MELLANISWFTPTWDLFVILFLFVAAFLLGLTIGRNKIIILLIGIYIAIVVINFFPLGDIFKTPKTDENFVYPIVLFIIIVVIFFFLLSNSALKKVLKKKGNKSVAWIIFFSLFYIGLLVSVVLSYFPQDLVDTFNPITQKVFMSDLAKFLWAIFPVAGMALMRTKRKKEFIEDY